LTIDRAAVGTRKPHQKEFIRRAATRLIERRGYHATAIGDIAKETGLNKATVYHYYAAKSEILCDIYQSGIDAILERLAAQPQDQGPLQALRTTVRDIVAVNAEDPSRSAVYYQERPFMEEIIGSQDYAAFRVKERQFARHVVEVIEAGVGSGDFAPIDAQAAAFTVIETTGHTHRWYRGGSGSTLEHTIEVVSQVLLSGLVTRERPTLPAADG
jgi:AcrR family transcriptional regulator